MSMVHVKGLKELNAALQTIAPRLERNVLRGALRAGAKDAILPEAKVQLAANGSVKTGELQRGLKVSTGGKGGRVIANVKVTGKHAHVAPWLEYGVAAHTITAKKSGWLSFGGLFAKSVEHPGFAAKPFMRPALDGKATEAVVKAAEYMKKRLATKHGIDTADINIEAET